MAELDTTEELISLGKISGVFGVKGWVKIHSFTDPREKIVEYGTWLVKHKGQWQPIKVEQGQRQGKTVVARLDGINDRDEAMLYRDDEIAIYRSQLDQLASGDYYWHQLEGLDVVTIDGTELGKVHHLLETGANDVLVVRGDRERLVPYTPGHAVTDVDLKARRITVDWDPEF